MKILMPCINNKIIKHAEKYNIKELLALLSLFYKCGDCVDYSHGGDEIEGHPDGYTGMCIQPYPSEPPWPAYKDQKICYYFKIDSEEDINIKEFYK